ncbi:carbon-nitrogen hydrolase family protein [Streptomyces sp. NPDC059002]|uniref:carbon-nitrogen hydrolase family protein n=1 Tax=Streptomyces sp. NPDC059002 TaxID=3346690 RepID=UPI0036B271F7
MDSSRSVAVAQIGCVPGDIDANLRRITETAEAAASAGVELIVFPECCLTGYLFDSRGEAEAVAVAADGPELATVAELSARLNLHLVVGALEKDGGGLYNSAFVIGPQGHAGVHRKAHLPPLGADLFVDEPPASGVSVFDTPLGRLGVMICYETRFPEVARTLALSGADIIALPTIWPVQSRILAEHFARVRAAENLVYLLVANRPDSEKATDFLGFSQIVAPNGEVLAVQQARCEEVLTARIDLDRFRGKRLVFDDGASIAPLEDRRPSTYAL